MTPSERGHVAEFASLPNYPSIFSLTARDGALFRSVLVTEGTTASGQYGARLAQVLEETWQAQSLHAARDDWCRLRHALPFLVVERGHPLRPPATWARCASPKHRLPSFRNSWCQQGCRWRHRRAKTWCGRKLCSRVESNGLWLHHCRTSKPKRFTTWPYRPYVAIEQQSLVIN
jgi:hypothetical protein